MNRKTKAAEFVDESYRIAVTGRHVLVTEAMKQYAIEKIAKIERFTQRLIDVQVTMDVQKQLHIVDIVLKAGHITVKGHGISSDMYASIDQAVKRIERQLIKYKDELVDHQKKGLSFVDMHVQFVNVPDEVELINEEIETANREELFESYKPHAIAKQQTMPLKTLSIEEAVMKMDLSSDPFLIFQDETDQRTKVIYQLKEGGYGMVVVQ